MEVVSNSFMPGDPRLIDRIVYELKSQGIFDNFRKECIADVDTKPAYQNLRQRVEGSVYGFLKTQKWKPDMNKNHVREMLRRNISESGFLETGVERIVDQVVNPKINSIFLPQVENIVYKYLGVQNPSAFDELKAQTNMQRYSDGIGGDRPDSGSNNLLPSDLETVSPESESQERKLDTSNESQKLDDRIDEDESPPFEPLEESSFMMLDENSGDSHMSGFSGLASHDSNHSFEDSHKIAPMEISNQDSHLSKQSSDDHLSIVMFDETDIKMDEDSSHSKMSKTTDSNSKNFDFMQDSHSSGDKSSQSTTAKTLQDKKSEDKKLERHRSSDKLDKPKSRHDSKSESRDRKSEKDRSEKDRKEHRDRNKHGSKDGKERKDSRSRSERDGEVKIDKEQKHEKDRDRGRNSSSRHGSSKDKNGSKKDSLDNRAKELKDLKIKEPENKDSKTKETKPKDSPSPVHKEAKSRDSKSRDDSKSKSGESSHSSKSRGDSKSHSKHNGKTKTDLSTSSIKPDEKTNKKIDKPHSRSERHSSSSKKDDKRDSKKEMKKLAKDDHYSMKAKNTNRRSTDRDSSDGHSGTQSSSSSFADSSTSSQVQKSSQETSRINSSSGESGNSDETGQNTSVTEMMSAMTEINVNTSASLDESTSQISPIQQLAPVKLIKPKFASNIFEARRLMKIRKKLGKIEKQNQMELINATTALSNANNGSNDIVAYEMVTQEEPTITLSNESETIDNFRRRPNILKKQSPAKPRLVSRINASTKPRQIFRKRTKPLNHHKKTYANRKNSVGKSRKVIKDRAEAEEEIVTESMEISDTSVSPLLTTSVVSQESWDAVEAKLNSQNILQVDYNSYSEPVDGEEISIKEPSKHEIEILDEDFLGFPRVSSADTENYFKVVHAEIARLDTGIKMIMQHQHMRTVASEKEKQTIAEEKEMEVINRRLPKVAIVDVTTDNEITISPTNKSIKRRRGTSQSDVHNNNKSKTQLKQVTDQLNHTETKVNIPPITTVQPKAKKSKVVHSPANHVDSFNLPLSPAESDKSFTTSVDKKNEKEDATPKRNSSSNKAANNVRNQRYSSDDLYKPRLKFTSSRGRSVNNSSRN